MMGVISLICIINGIGGLIGIALYIFWGLVLHPAHGLICWIRKCHKENKWRREQERLKPVREEYEKAREEMYATDLAERTEWWFNRLRALHSSSCWTDEEIRRKAQWEAHENQYSWGCRHYFELQEKEGELWREICLKNGLEDYSSRMP